MEEVVKKLKEKRKELGISLEQAEADTNIRLDYLQAIEEGKFDRIKGEVFLKGFLKVYSAYLGFDKKEILEKYSEYKKEEEGETDKSVEKKGLKESLREYIDRYQNRLLVVTIIVVIVISALLLFLLGTKVYDLITDYTGSNFNSNLSKEVSSVAELEDIAAQKKAEIKVEDESPTEKEVKEDNIDSKKEETAVVSNKEEMTIKVKTIKNSWYAVDVDGKRVFASLVKADEVKTFTGKKIVLKAGNAAGVVVFKGDQKLGPFGAEGEVITKEFSIDLDEE